MPDLRRLRKDIAEIKELRNVKVTFPDKSDLTNFIVTLKVDDGLYRKKWINFRFIIPNEWPNEKPDVKILDKIWHPNIELVIDGNEKTGNVCVSTLGKNYLASTLLVSIVESLKFILVNPNPNDARNPEAGDEQNKEYQKFKENVSDYLDQLEDAD